MNEPKVSPRTCRIVIGFCFSLFLICLAGTPAQDENQANRLSTLLKGVSEIAAPGVPGIVCPFGENAFAVVAGSFQKVQAPVVAASSLGMGRIVLFGHGGYLSKGALEKGDTGQLMKNLLVWVTTGKGNPGHTIRIGVINLPSMVTWLKKQSFQAKALDKAKWSEQLRELDVVCVGSDEFGAREIPALRRFIQGGGGLVTGVTPWGWRQLNPGKSLVTDFAPNRLFAEAGLLFADGLTGWSSGIGYDATKLPSEYCHAGNALAALLASKKGRKKLKPEEIKQIGTTMQLAVQTLPEKDSVIRPRVAELFAGMGERAIPTPKKPLTVRKHPIERLYITWQFQKEGSLPPKQVKAHPAAKAFPGEAPPGTKEIDRTIKINTGVPRWHSTGLYAPAGKLITVSVPPAAAGKKLKVRIGSHSDRIWHKDFWRRIPDISRTFEITRAETPAANAFGGLIYIEVPKNCPLGKVPVTVSGGVEAPYFELGKTDPEEWRTSIRNRPAPWAELACSSIIYTVPSSCIRNLDDPESLMKLWDTMMNAMADFAGIPHQRPFPFRFVLDTEISAGYMHAGYPIMAHLDAVYSVDKARVLKGLWGNLHEIGHNHQKREWTFSGTGEVTNNIFVLYVREKVCGIPLATEKRVGKVNGAKLIAQHFRAGATFDRWKSKPFTALVTYSQLAQAFGWDPFKKVFAEYRDLPANQKPKTDDERRDQWMVRFSRAVGRNLGPFFRAWNIPTSEKARASIANLPPWMPENFPPKVPTAYLRNWQLSPITQQWTDYGKFAPMDGAKLQRILASGWKGKRIQSPTAFIDFARKLPRTKRENTAAYLITTLESPANMKVKLYTGSDDALRLWLNDKLVQQVLTMRAVDYDSEVAEATLVKGPNTILAEVSNGGGPSGFCLRLEDSRGHELRPTSKGILKTSN